MNERDEIREAIGYIPDVDACTHEWRRPYAVVGGCRENPGVWSMGGTRLREEEVCKRCGLYRTTYYAGSQRNPDEPEERREYEAPDEGSLAWIEEAGS